MPSPKTVLTGVLVTMLGLWVYDLLKKQGIL